MTLSFVKTMTSSSSQTGALRVAGRLEQELREGGAVRVDAEGRREREKGGDGAQGRQEAADPSQSGDDLDRSVFEPRDKTSQRSRMEQTSLHLQHRDGTFTYIPMQ